MSKPRPRFQAASSDAADSVSIHREVGVLLRGALEEILNKSPVKRMHHGQVGRPKPQVLDNGDRLDPIWARVEERRRDWRSLYESLLARTERSHGSRLGGVAVRSRAKVSTNKSHLSAH